MTSSSGISFSGLFSGLDTDSIISQLMTVERQPVTLLETKEAKLGYEKTALLAVNNSLLSLKTALGALSDGLSTDTSFNSSNESVLTGSTDSLAEDGSYSVVVNNIARAQIVASTAAGTVTAGTFSITTGAHTFNVTVTAAEALSDVADAINTQISGYGTAQVITGGGVQYLTIKNSETGIANAFTFENVGASTTLDDLGIGTTSGGDLNVPVGFDAVDASLTIDGVTISSASNHVADAITGVTLDLVDDGSATVNIGVDSDNIVSLVSAFVTQYNASIDLVKGYVSANPVAADKIESDSDYEQGILHGDYDLVSLMSGARIATTGYINAGASVYKVLSSIGIDSEAYSGGTVSNHLVFDEDTFRSALADDKDEVFSTLEGWATGTTGTGGLNGYLESQTKVSTVSSYAGNVYRRILSIDEKVDNIGDDISNWEDRLAVKEEQLRTEYSNMEEALAQLQTTSNYLTSQLAALTSSSSSSK
jgi:flagellar hook-associated protein 2